MASVVEEHEQRARPRTRLAPPGRRRRVALPIALGVVAAVGLVERCWPRGALWLDEAQSVAIARLPLTRIVGALREDGAPPVYYLLLHAWMWLFGSGDIAVRSLSVLMSVGFVAVIVVAARRLAGERAAACVFVLATSSSFAVRYASEARMYSLVMLEAALLLIAVAAMLARPTVRAGVAVALLSAALPYTHYWGIYLLVAGAVLLGGAELRAGDAARRRAARWTLVAVAAGGVLWLPWLPVFRFQSQHTATPWTTSGGLTSILDSTFRWNRTEAAGGALLAAVAAGTIFAVVRGGRLWRAVQLPRWAIAAAATGALVLAALGGSISGSAYVGRYSAVAFPFAVLLAGVGIAAIRPRPLAVVVLVAVWALGAGYSIDEIRTPRTRATRVADALLSRVRPGDIVVYCPDQLGPATSRLLERSAAMDATNQLVYPGGAPPERVDWVDYARRYRDAFPAPFARDLVAQAGGHVVWVVASTLYPATQDSCAALLTAIGTIRPDASLLVVDDPLIADHGALWRFGTARRTAS